MMGEFRTALLVVVCGGAGLGCAAEEVSFSRDIRPLLSDRCFQCHGFDEETKEADLGLHRFDEATRDLGGYRAIVPGDAGASEVLARILSHDSDEVMPPPKANKPRFSEEEVALLTRWIEEGAKYETHWAFEKPVRAELPAGDAPHPVDRFLDARLAEADLSVNGRADPHTLVRRLSFDLRGVPPTLGEVEEFVAAAAVDFDGAWKELVDSFLASPLYGERWARDWLDLARYADTNGYEKDRPRSIWPYRDWVVDALNADMPYDRFTIEQLAGDMLPEPTTDQLVATGFHRNTMLNEEGGIDPLEFRYHAMVDRVATTGTVWLGLTTGCAQCHTHKFDPITHVDYFSMMALLNNADEPEIAVPTPELRERGEAVAGQVAALEKEAVAKIDPGKFERWNAEQDRRIVQWIPLEPTSMKSNLPLLQKQDDLSIFASGDFTKRDVFEVVFDASAAKEGAITAIRIEALPDDRLPAGGPGAAYYEGRKGDFFLSEVDVTAGGKKLEFSNASVSFGKISVGSGKATGMNIYDGDGSTGWSTSSQEGKRNELVLNLSEPVSGAKELEVTLLFERHFVAALGRFRISVTTDTGEVVADNSGIPHPAVASMEEMKLAYLRHAKENEAFQAELARLQKQVPAYPTTLVFRERPEENPRVTHLHHRGEYLSPREPVEPAVPAVFEPIPESEPRNRLGFARWLVSERNPLAARVAVNRSWRAFFGSGILVTAGDFGYQSGQPSHPELLDWLAVEFVEQGWSFKKLHRLLVTSEAYLRDSRVGSEQLEKDPENRLLARGARFRLTGEMIRDGVLQSSGLLSRKQGGPGVYPPQPDSVTDLSYGRMKWTPSPNEDRYRRSLYTFAKRTAPFAAYLAFDGPTGESCLPRRDRSNTPIQALTLLNDPMFAEGAEAIARAAGPGTDGKPADPEGVIDGLFLRILTRPPSDREREEFLAYFESQKKRLEAGELSVEEVLAGSPGEHAEELAAWKMVARVLYNLNEFVTKG